MKNMSFVLLMLASGLAQAVTTCQPGEQKYYVLAKIFTSRSAGVVTQYVCSQPGDHESEEGHERLLEKVSRAAKGKPSDRWALTTIMPLMK